MSDKFSSHASGLESPADYIAAIVPDDATDLARASRALNVAQSGYVRVTTTEGHTATLYIVAGIGFPVRAARILATGTTATGIVVLA